MLEDSKKTSRSIFSAISSNNLMEVNEILDRDSSVLNQIGSSKYTPIFHAILGKKKEIVDTIINRDPSVLNQKSLSGNTPISLAIQSGNLEIVKVIIKKAPWVLEQKDSKGDTPIFIAIRSGNLDIVKAILEEDRSVLSVLKQENSSGDTPIFHAILSKKKEIVKAIIEEDPLVLKQTDENGHTPISLAIKLGNLELVKAIIEEDPLALKQTISLAILSGNLELVKAIIKTHPLVLGEKDSAGRTLIFYAIKLGNPELVKAIIEEDPLVLKQTNENGHTPISLTILSGNLELVKAIIETYPLVLGEKDSVGMTPISWATLATIPSRDSFCSDKDKASEVLQIILDHQFKGRIDKAGQEDLKELFSKKMLLKGIYSEEEAPFYFECLEKAFDKITPENTFKKIYQDLFKNVDKNQPITSTKNEEMFIFQSKLNRHVSFFIFHVNKKDGKLTSISYCDGNIFDEKQKIKDSATHINGVTTFHLKAPIEYSYEKFVKNFIEKNSENKSIEDLYEKFTKNAIEIEEAEIDYAKTTHSIPTKAQKRGNCVLKNSFLIAQKILEAIDPTMKSGFDIASQKPTGARYDEYKEFKDDLAKKTLESIIEIKEGIFSKSDSLSEHLKKDIEGIMQMVETHNEKKLSKDDQPRKEFHEEIKTILSDHKALSLTSGLNTLRMN